jgi:hypothetical protein
MVTKHELAKHPDYVAAIGIIALEVVDLELELAVLLARTLMVTPKVGEAIYMSPKADRARLDILEHVAQTVFATKSTGRPTTRLGKQKYDAREKVLAIVKRCRASIESRHRVIHDDWYISGETQEIKRMMVDGKVTREGVKVTLDELDDIIKKLRRLIDDVTKLSEEFRKNPPQMVSMRRD